MKINEIKKMVKEIKTDDVVKIEAYKKTNNSRSYNLIINGFVEYDFTLISSRKYEAHEATLKEINYVVKRGNFKSIHHV